MFKKKLNVTLSTLLLLFVLWACPASVTSSEVCGDVNYDLVVDIADLVLFVQSMWIDPLPFPIEDGDINGDGLTDIGDVVHMLDYQFRGGNPPVCDVE